MNKKYFFLGIPLLLSIAFSLLLTLEPIQNIENSIYDMLLRIKPEVKENEDLVLVNIDDLTITNINMYPLGRDIFADGLLLMKELGTNWAILDIEFIDKSPAGLNNQYLEEQIPGHFDTAFLEISQQEVDLFQALQAGQISLRELPDYLDQLYDINESRKQELLNKVSNIARDNDFYLGRAVKGFGNVICTVNMMDDHDETTPPELKVLARDKVSLNPKFSTPYEGFTPAAEIKPAIAQVLESSKSAGYPRVNIDPDGVRRRIDLIYDYQGEYYPQLGFSALLQLMDVSEMERTAKSLILRNAEQADGTRGDIEIPLDREGKMMINWPAKNYSESFRHISFFHLYRHDRLMDDLAYNLDLMSQYGLLDAPFFTGEYPLMDLYGYLAQIRTDHMNGSRDMDMNEYVSLRETFISETDAFINGSAEQDIIDELSYYLTFPDLPEDQAVFYNDLIAFTPEIFSASRDLIGQIIELRTTLTKDLKDSVAVIGYSGTSTTDIGVNPFEEKYMNMGLYAAVANTILSGQFLDESPLWLPMVVAIVMSLLTAFIVSRLSHPALGLSSGIILLFLTEGALILNFVFTGVYVPLFTPGISILLSFIAIVSVNLIFSSREKGFIRSAFAQYLSDDVIKDLLDDPSKLTLGGEERHMTAVFTDVKGFSSISEKLTPQNLVTLLNDYLTEMSDLIMAERGTIDKYEGDAIIAFYGAPQPYQDHAIRACRSAIRMKKAETQLNEKLLEEGRSPGPLLTRIGINTGNMVVGNMGTLQKMDYTMMGNAVNLAARLEGVNKQYGTWLLISDATHRETGELFTVRQLDRVRVVGINEPVRLYELVDERQLTPDNVLEGLSFFHKGLELFENRVWSEASDMFKKCHNLIDDDAPSEIYMKRCLKFSQDPPPDEWDGVFNLTQK